MPDTVLEAGEIAINKQKMSALRREKCQNQMQRISEGMEKRGKVGDRELWWWGLTEIAGEASLTKWYHKGSEGNWGGNLLDRRLSEYKGPEAGGCLIFTERQGQCAWEGVLGITGVWWNGRKGPDHTGLCGPLQGLWLLLWGRREPLQSFEERNEMLQALFKKDHLQELNSLGWGVTSFIFWSWLQSQTHFLPLQQHQDALIFSTCQDVSRPWDTAPTVPSAHSSLAWLTSTHQYSAQMLTTVTTPSP